MSRDSGRIGGRRPLAPAPYNKSNSLLKQIKDRVSGLFGGYFQSRTSDSLSSPSQQAHAESIPPPELATKRPKLSTSSSIDLQLPISPIPTEDIFFRNNHNLEDSASRLFHNRDNAVIRTDLGLSLSEENRPIFRITEERTSDEQPGPSGVRSSTVSLRADDQSDSSESTSGCSSLVPQCDRSQSAFAATASASVSATARRKAERTNLDDSLKFARNSKPQFSRIIQNRSIPLKRSDDNLLSSPSSSQRMPSFDVSAFRSTMMNKSNSSRQSSSYYAGPTTFGGASAVNQFTNYMYRSRSSISLNNRQLNNSCFSTSNFQNNSTLSPKPNATQLQVKTAADTPVMSQTALRVLAALQELPTPLNDARRIPATPSSPLFASKRKAHEQLDEDATSSKRMRNTSNTRNPNTIGLDVPTTAELLKLHRVQRLHESTIAAREVARKAAKESVKMKASADVADAPLTRTQVQETYSLPVHKDEEKKMKPSTGKITIRDAKKVVSPQKTKMPILPKVTLSITTLPTFTFTTDIPTTSSSSIPTSVVTPKLPIVSEPVSQKSFTSQFTFSPPFVLACSSASSNKTSSSDFQFSEAITIQKWQEQKLKVVQETKKDVDLHMIFKSDAYAKVKEKSPIKELKATETVENVLSSATSAAAETSKTVSVSVSKPSTTTTSFPLINLIDKSTTWTCDTCLVPNKKSDLECVCCKSKQPVRVNGPVVEQPTGKPDEKKVTDTTTIQGFGDAFKRKSDQWECPVCMINNKSADLKCVACETAKPGSEVSDGKSGGSTGWSLGVSNSGTDNNSATKNSGIFGGFNSGTVGGLKSGGALDVSGSGTLVGSSKGVFGGFKFGIDPDEAKKVTTPANGLNSSLLSSTTSGQFSFGINVNNNSTMKKEGADSGSCESKDGEMVCSPTKEAITPSSKSTSNLLISSSSVTTEAKTTTASNPPTFTFGIPNQKPPSETPSTTFVAPQTTSTSTNIDFTFKSTTAPQVNSTSSFFGNGSTNVSFTQFAPTNNPPTTSSSLNFTFTKPADVPKPSFLFNSNPRPTFSFGQSNQESNPPFMFSGNTTNPNNNTGPGLSFGNAQQQPASDTTTSFSFGSSPFVFGGNQHSSNTTPSGLGMFGSSGATPSSNPSEQSIFAFGGSNSSAPANPSGVVSAFQFGTSSAPATIAFGATAAATPAQTATLAPFDAVNNNAPAPGPTSTPALPQPSLSTFSTVVPSSFNFTGGQTPAFSATSNHTPQRRIIRAVRRTQR